MKTIGLKEFQLSIGHVGFIQSLFEATNLEDEEKEESRTLIANRNSLAWKRFWTFMERETIR